MSQFEVLHNCYMLAVFSYFPVIFFCLVMGVQDRNLIIRAPNLKINYTFARWDAEAKYAAAIWIGASFFLILLLAKHVSRNLDTVYLGIGPAFLAISGTIALCIEHFRLLEVYENNSKLIKTVSVFSVLVVGYVAGTVTNASIAEYTHTNASNFPDAQRIIATLVSVGVWLYAAVGSSLIVYSLVAAMTLFRMISNEREAKKKLRYKNCLIGLPSKRSGSDSKEMIMLTSLLLGASVTVSAPLAYLKTLKASSLDNFAKYLLVETSFQLSPDLCGVQTPEGSAMSLLPFRQAAIAVPSEKIGYQFSIIECNRKFEEFPTLTAKVPNDAVEAKH